MKINRLFVLAIAIAVVFVVVIGVYYRIGPIQEGTVTVKDAEAVFVSSNMAQTDGYYTYYIYDPYGGILECSEKAYDRVKIGKTYKCIMFRRRIVSLEER